MKKILLFCMFVVFGICGADAAVRDNNTASRQTNTATQTSGTSARTAVASPRASATSTRNTTSQNVTARNAATNVTPVGVTTPISSRAAATRAISGTTSTQASPARSATTTAARSAITNQRTSVVARAATDGAVGSTSTAMSDTRTGAEYERCKNAYFTCMDQFCKLKNDDYRRCSCSDRIYEFKNTRATLQDANDKLTTFTENLDIVGMTSAQATAMRTASEGEKALTDDGSASKALLQAIMNSIKGEDSTVSNSKFSDLNSINLSFDTSNAFGTMDAGQAVAAYNGKGLYSAIYPQCRQAVRADCNDASLQRAVTAYLMAIEQDCNTVGSAIADTQKKMTSAVREGNAMLDLARVENRQAHNSSDMTACLNEVEAAILSEEVCGPGYRKCLDNGEFIDVSTGAPIAGVVKFYELENLLTYNTDTSVSEQNLSKVSSNRTFVLNFEKRVKKFAEPALDKCREKADDVWADYLDKAMVDIFYAQKSKVSEIKQGCFDFVSACYVNGDTALTLAMASLTGDAATILQPDKITVNSAVCREYVESCDNMFDGNIVAQYVEDRDETDKLSACRAVAKQCFDKYGGNGYENFYYPSSGLFTSGRAPDWFSLNKYRDGTLQADNYASQCAQQLKSVAACSDPTMMEKAFGGFDLFETTDDGKVKTYEYGLKPGATLDERGLRSTGVATEVYYQIIDTLNNNCNTLNGRFMEMQFIKLKETSYNVSGNNVCEATFTGESEYALLAYLYGVAKNENMCPRGYDSTVDTQSWGACLCWENGARRSRYGTSVKCLDEMPFPKSSGQEKEGESCNTLYGTSGTNDSATLQTYYNNLETKPIVWCSQNMVSKDDQICPIPTTKRVTNDDINDDINLEGHTGKCLWPDNLLIPGESDTINRLGQWDRIPEGINKIPVGVKSNSN